MKVRILSHIFCSELSSARKKQRLWNIWEQRWNLPSCFLAYVSAVNWSKIAITVIKITIFPIITTRFSSHTKKRTASIRETEWNDILTSQFQFMTHLRETSRSQTPRLFFLVFERVLLWIFSNARNSVRCLPKKERKNYGKKIQTTSLGFF